jgi:hypothetical protein
MNRILVFTLCGAATALRSLAQQIDNNSAPLGVAGLAKAAIGNIRPRLEAGISASPIRSNFAELPKRG